VKVSREKDVEDWNNIVKNDSDEETEKEIEDRWEDEAERKRGQSCRKCWKRKRQDEGV
jgi:hypothetical protein